MYESGGVGGGQSSADLAADIYKLGEAYPCHHLGECATGQILHYVVQATVGQLTDVEDVDEVVVADLADLARLLKEALDQLLVLHDLGAQDLARGAVAEGDMLGGVDDSHRAFAQEAGDQIVTDPAADQRIGRAGEFSHG